MKRAALLAVALAVLLPSAARAHTTISAPAGSGFAYQAWVDEAHIPTPNVTVAVHEEQGTCVGGLGCAGPSDIWLPIALWGGAKRVFLHELGHVFDMDVMSDPARQRFEEIIGLQGPWFQPTLGDGSPTEWFADTYMLCALRSHERLFGGEAGNGSLTRVQSRRACAFIRWVALHAPRL